MCTISCKVDDNVKLKADAIFEELGLSMSAAINIFLRAAIRENGLPVKTNLGIKIDEIIEQRLKEAENPENLSPKFKSMEEAEAWLNA